MRSIICIAYQQCLQHATYPKRALLLLREFEWAYCFGYSVSLANWDSRMTKRVTRRYCKITEQSNYLIHIHKEKHTNTQLTRFFVGSKMLSNLHIRWKHLLEWPLYCWNEGPNAWDDAMVLTIHWESDGYCYRPNVNIANSLQYQKNTHVQYGDSYIFSELLNVVDKPTF